MATIGYFARATEGKKTAKTTMTHVIHLGKVLCRYKPHKTMNFQWCSMGINERTFETIECKECRKKYAKILNKLMRILQ